MWNLKVLLVIIYHVRGGLFFFLLRVLKIHKCSCFIIHSTAVHLPGLKVYPKCTAKKIHTSRREHECLMFHSVKKSVMVNKKAIVKQYICKYNSIT